VVVKVGEDEREYVCVGEADAVCVPLEDTDPDGLMVPDFVTMTVVVWLIDIRGDNVPLTVFVGVVEAVEVLLFVGVAEIVRVPGMLLDIKGVNVTVRVDLVELDKVVDAVGVRVPRIEPVVLGDPVVVFELVIVEVLVAVIFGVFVVLGEAVIDVEDDAVFDPRIECVIDGEAVGLFELPVVRDKVGVPEELFETDDDDVVVLLDVVVLVPVTVLVVVLLLKLLTELAGLLEDVRDNVVVRVAVFVAVFVLVEVVDSVTAFVGRVLLDKVVVFVEVFDIVVVDDGTTPPIVRTRPIAFISIGCCCELAIRAKSDMIENIIILYINGYFHLNSYQFYLT